MKRLSSTGAATRVLFQGLQMNLDGLFGVPQGFIDAFSLRIAARQNRDLGPESAFLCLVYQNCIIHCFLADLRRPILRYPNTFAPLCFALYPRSLKQMIKIEIAGSKHGAHSSYPCLSGYK
jgi:hypothetical protein